MRVMKPKIKDQSYLTIEDGEELIGAIKKFAEKEDIRAGTIEGIGGCKKLVAGYVDVDSTGTPNVPTEFKQETVFNHTPIGFTSGAEFKTPERMPYEDILFSGDISVTKKEDGTINGRVVHIHLGYGGANTGPRGVAYTPEAYSGKGHEHYHGRAEPDGKVVHVLEAVIGPYANVGITAYDGEFVREMNPKTKVSEIMRFEPALHIPRS